MSAPARATSLDAYRGFVMLLMLGEVLALPRVAKQSPESGVWRTVLFHTTHVEWRGCSLHDLIQPSFSFLVGAALAYSIAKRRATGQKLARASLHAAWRTFALIALGIVLRSVGRAQTNFTFEDTLTQIGLGYFPLFLIAWHSRGRLAVPAIAALVLLLGTWASFAACDLEWVSNPLRDPHTWPHHLHGFEARWEKNENLAWAFDTWFLNLFPRETPFVKNRGGYCTLSFIPTLATMILGLIAGGWLREPWTPWPKAGWLAFFGAMLLVAGCAIDAVGLCPMVKRIWTPSWVLFSGGWCFVLLALFHAATDAVDYRGWSYPLRVVGANSILIYCVAEVPIAAFLIGSIKTHFGPDAFLIFGAQAEPVVAGAAVLGIYWVGLWWLYAKRVFVRI